MTRLAGERGGSSSASSIASLPAHGPLATWQDSTRVRPMPAMAASKQPPSAHGQARADGGGNEVAPGNETPGGRKHQCSDRHAAMEEEAALVLAHAVAVRTAGPAQATQRIEPCGKPVASETAATPPRPAARPSLAPEIRRARASRTGGRISKRAAMAAMSIMP